MFRRCGTTGRLPQATALSLVAGAGLLAIALALATPAGPVWANGTPIRIVLSYLNGVSNFGSQNATGVAEMITSEGEARLTAAGLEKLADNEEYQVWISVDGAERTRLGSVQVTDAGVGRMDLVLKQPIPEKAWDLMVVTVEAKGSTPAGPSEKRAIAGRFSMTPAGGTPPKVLPNTGGTAPNASAAPSGLLGLSGGGIALLGLLVAGVVGFALGRTRVRRSS